MRGYTYRVLAVHRVVDGDTYDLTLDVGFHLSATVRVRLLGWDTPELTGPTEREKAEARRAREVAAAWWGTLNLGGATWWVRTEKDDAFGRWVGDVWFEDGEKVEHLGPTLAVWQLATPWPTRWRDVYGIHAE